MDAALRFTPHSFRKWSEMRVADTAFGAPGMTIVASDGLPNADQEWPLST